MHPTPTVPPTNNVSSEWSRRALAVVQLVVNGILAALWFFCGIGITMCSDAGSGGYCSRVTQLWNFTGLGLAANFAAGIFLFVTAGSRPSRLSRRAAPYFSAAALTLLIAVGIPFLNLVNGPIR
jgi:hypothetical protein